MARIAARSKPTINTTPTATRAYFGPERRATSKEPTINAAPLMTTIRNSGNGNSCVAMTIRARRASVSPTAADCIASLVVEATYVRSP